MAAPTTNVHNNTIRQSIKLLLEDQRLTPEQVSSCMREIMTSEASPSQIGSFLMALALKSHHLTPEFLHTCATTMSSFSIPCRILVENDQPILDIVGTGGDTADTFNASTAAAFVVASSGTIVAKHGNRSSSGKCGSADFVEALGAKIDLTSDQIEPIISKLKFGFLFAQKFHPAMKSVAPIRKEIGIRTIFNILGPLTNPAQPTAMLAGVGTPELGKLYSEIFALRRLKRALVVHSHDGLDEISTTGSTTAWLVENGTIKEMTLHPEHDFGLTMHPLEHIAGSTPPKNVERFLQVLKSDGKIPHKDPLLNGILDFILLNASAALFVAGVVQDFREGVELARNSITSGKAHHLVQSYISLTNAQ